MAKHKAKNLAPSLPRRPAGNQAGQTKITQHFKAIIQRSGDDHLTTPSNELKTTQHFNSSTQCGDHDHLSRLPDEILLRIFSFIPRPDSLHKPRATYGTPAPATCDYLSLSLTCRSLNNAATSMLYQTYFHNWDHVSSAKFITTLIAKPTFARLVKVVREVGSWNHAWDRFHCVARRYRNADIVESMRSLMADLEIPQADAYNALLFDDQDLYHNLEAALILFQTPNIERLSLNCAPGLKTLDQSRFGFDKDALREPHAALLPLLYAAQSIPYGKVHNFKNLKSLRLRMRGFHMNTVSPVLRLQSLRDLVLFDYTDMGFDLDDPPCKWACPPCTSTVENIRLDNFDGHLGSLEHLLKSCRALKKFSLTTPFEDVPAWQWPKFKTLLHEHQPNLKALAIKDMRQGDQGFERLGSLEGFTYLEYLAVALEFLVDPSDKTKDSTLDKVLPPSLQTLVLSKGGEKPLPQVVEETFDRVECDRQVQTVLNACQTGRISLKTFGIWYHTRFPSGISDYLSVEEYGDLDDVHFDFYGFAKRFKALGICFDYVIRVHHGQEHKGRHILIPTRVKRSKQIERLYRRHLSCSFDYHFDYSFKGVEHPTFFDEEDDEYQVNDDDVKMDNRARGVETVPFYAEDESPAPV